MPYSAGMPVVPTGWAITGPGLRCLDPKWESIRLQASTATASPAQHLPFSRSGRVAAGRLHDAGSAVARTITSVVAALGAR
jgi:hypothetical protein